MGEDKLISNIKKGFRNFFISDDDTWNILKMYMFLPFLFTFFWFYGVEVNLIINYIYFGMIILFVFLFVYACFYHRGRF